MFEVRNVYSNVEKVMDLITVHTLLEFLTKNGYDCDEDQVRDIFLESFKPKNSRGKFDLQFEGNHEWDPTFIKQLWLNTISLLFYNVMANIL